MSLLINKKKGKLKKKAIFHSDGRRTFVCRACGYGPMKRDDFDCLNPKGCSGLASDGDDSDSDSSPSSSSSSSASATTKKSLKRSSQEIKSKSTTSSSNTKSKPAPPSLSTSASPPPPAKKKHYPPFPRERAEIERKRKEMERLEMERKENERKENASSHDNVGDDVEKEEAEDEEDDSEQLRKKAKLKGRDSPAAVAAASPTADDSSSSAPPPRPSSPPVPPMPQHPSASRLDANVLAESQLTLRTTYEFVNALLTGANPHCELCNTYYEDTQPAARTATPTAASSSSSTPTHVAPKKSSSPSPPQFDRTPRVLNCGHTFCAHCLEEQLRLNIRQIPCPACHVNHSLPYSLTSTTPLLALELIPHNHALLKQMTSPGTFTQCLREVHGSIQRLVQAATASVSVIHTSADVKIDETALLQRETELHAQKSVQLVKLQAKRNEQLKIAAFAEQEASKKRAAVEAEVRLIKMETKRIDDERRAKRAAERANNSSDDEVDTSRHKGVRSSPTSAAATASNLFNNLTSSRSASSIVWSDSMAKSSICGIITPSQRLRLHVWLARVHAQLSSCRLIYRASRDGWYSNDFFSKCADKGPTLVLCKVASKPYVFGVFSCLNFKRILPYYAPHSGDDSDHANKQQSSSSPSSSSTSLQFTNVMDRSNTSFIFSLENRFHFPFKMTLPDSPTAIPQHGYERHRARNSSAMVHHPHLGPMWGGKEKTPEGSHIQWPNLSLLWNSRPGHAASANIFNDPKVSKCSYQYEYEDGYTPPKEFVVDHTTLADQQQFAMEEMEVYRIQVRPEK